MVLKTFSRIIMKTTYNVIGLLTIFFIALGACKKKDTTPDVVLPTNLQTTISHASGNTSIQASAQNANFYSFTFFENGDSTQIEFNKERQVIRLVKAGRTLLKQELTLRNMILLKK